MRHATMGACVVSLCLSIPCLAAPTGYALDLFGNLKQVDLNGPTVTLMGYTGVGSGQLGGLAINNANQLYATDNAGMLYVVANNGALTTVANTGVPGLRGLDFDSTYTNMIAVDNAAPPRLWQITPAGVATPMAVTNTTAGPAESFVVASPTVGFMLCTSGGGTEFSRVNLLNGNVTPLSTIPTFPAMGLDFASDGNLYALAWTGKTYQINPANGAFTQTVNTGGEDWVALAAPIPEPTALSLLAPAGLCFVRRRRSCR